MSHEAEILYLGIGAPLTFVVLLTIVAIVASRASKPSERRSVFVRAFIALRARRKAAKRAKRIREVAEKRQRDAAAPSAPTLQPMPDAPNFRIAKVHRIVARKKRRLVVVSDYPDGTSVAKLRTKKGHYRSLGTSPTSVDADQAFIDAAQL